MNKIETLRNLVDQRDAAAFRGEMLYFYDLVEEGPQDWLDLAARLDDQIKELLAPIPCDYHSGTGWEPGCGDCTSLNKDLGNF